MRRNILIIGFIVCLTLFAGCASFPVQKTSRPMQPLEQSPMLKFEDVPVPAGFKLLANDSFIFHTDVTRIGLLKYTGGPTADQVVNFYRENMPQFGWTMLNIVEYGRRILNFDKDDQTCIITVEPATTKTIIIISVAPKSKGLRPATTNKLETVNPRNK